MAAAFSHLNTHRLHTGTVWNLQQLKLIQQPAVLLMSVAVSRRFEAQGEARDGRRRDSGVRIGGTRFDLAAGLQREDNKRSSLLGSPSTRVHSMHANASMNCCSSSACMQLMTGRTQCTPLACQNGREAISHNWGRSARVAFTHSSLASSSRRESRRRAAVPPHPLRDPEPVPEPLGPVVLVASDNALSPADDRRRLTDAGRGAGRATSSPLRASSHANPPSAKKLRSSNAPESPMIRRRGVGEHWQSTQIVNR